MSEPSPTSLVRSPCVQVCKIDPLLRLCIGCGRTLDEIGGWAKYSDAQRDQVFGQLPGRMRHLKVQRRAAGLPEAAPDLSAHQGRPQ